MYVLKHEQRIFNFNNNTYLYYLLAKTMSDIQKNMIKKNTAEKMDKNKKLAKVKSIFLPLN